MSNLIFVITLSSGATLMWEEYCNPFRSYLEVRKSIEFVVHIDVIFVFASDLCSFTCNYPRISSVC